MTTNNTSKKPTHTAFHVKEGKNDNDKSFWTRIGVAWAHKDGKGFNVSLDLIPQDGRIAVRINEDKGEN